MNSEIPEKADAQPYWASAEDADPLFAAEVFGRELTRDDDAVARRYAGNPWYRRRQHSIHSV